MHLYVPKRAPIKIDLDYCSLSVFVSAFFVIKAFKCYESIGIQPWQPSEMIELFERILMLARGSMFRVRAPEMIKAPMHIFDVFTHRVHSM